MIWTHKQLDKVTEICQRYAGDASVPEPSRRLFSDALAIARNIQERPMAERRHNVEQAFEVLCTAAHSAGFCKCKEPAGDFHCCQFIGYH